MRLFYGIICCPSQLKATSERDASFLQWQARTLPSLSGPWLSVTDILHSLAKVRPASTTELPINFLAVSRLINSIADLTLSKAQYYHYITPPAIPAAPQHQHV